VSELWRWRSPLPESQLDGAQHLRIANDASRAAGVVESSVLTSGRTTNSTNSPPAMEKIRLKTKFLRVKGHRGSA